MARGSSGSVPNSAWAIVDVRAQQAGVQQVGHAQAVAMNLVFVCRANAAARGADGRAAGRGLRGKLDHAVIGQNDLGAVGDEELAIGASGEALQTGLAQLPNLVQEGLRVEHDTVADDALAARTKHPAGNQL
jgi:hypothetical protein